MPGARCQGRLRSRRDRKAPRQLDLQFHIGSEQVNYPDHRTCSVCMMPSSGVGFPIRSRTHIATPRWPASAGVTAGISVTVTVIGELSMASDVSQMLVQVEDREAGDCFWVAVAGEERRIKDAQCTRAWTHRISDVPVPRSAAAPLKLHDAGTQAEVREEIRCSHLLDAVEPWHMMEGSQ